MRIEFEPGDVLTIETHAREKMRAIVTMVLSDALCVRANNASRDVAYRDVRSVELHYGAKKIAVPMALLHATARGW